MFEFKFIEGLEPQYMTKHSAAADIFAAASLVIPPRGSGKVPTGLFIKSVDWESVPKGFVPELQLRARSGLAFKNGITMLNGVGTIDADYRDEICVLLLNTRDEFFEVKKGDRIAQMVTDLVVQIPTLPVKENERSGGFGSTGV